LGSLSRQSGAALIHRPFLLPLVAELPIRELWSAFSKGAENRDKNNKRQEQAPQMGGWTMGTSMGSE